MAEIGWIEQRSRGVGEKCAKIVRNLQLRRSIWPAYDGRERPIFWQIQMPFVGVRAL